jgi:DNA repair exonuclease SbcCD ATPase subunit
MDTLSELKSGAVKDKLSINTTIEGNQNVTPSGGQLRKITLACDLALMDIVAQREGTAIDLLLMDEVLDGLDATGRSRIMDLLTHLKKQRGTIFLVTHDPELLEFMEKFDRIINVTKQDGVSDIRIE